MEQDKKLIEISELRNLFPVFDQRALLDWLLEVCIYKEIPAHTQVMQSGTHIRYVPLVLSGSVKVSRPDDVGREIFLYYILPGETCAMTLNACYKHEMSRINAETQENSRLLLLPSELVYDAARRYPSWQQFTYDSFGRRFDELLQTLESVVFLQLDDRLKHYLHEKASVLQTRQLKISQQDIADDLNSSREVISRLIRQFEQQGFLRHSRGIIELCQE
jgi:CRP/FNR family transcriptional regulator